MENLSINRAFAVTDDGIYAIDENGVVILTPKTGNEIVLKRTYERHEGMWRAFVEIGGRRLDILELLHSVFKPDQNGIAYNRHGDKWTAKLDDLIILPDKAIMYDIDDLYVAQALNGEILAAEKTIEELSSKLAPQIKANYQEVYKAARAYYHYDVKDQPIDEIALRLGCTDETGRGFTFRVLRAYETADEFGRQVIMNLINTAPIHEWRVYLRWLYTLRATHKEAAIQMDVCQKLLKYVIRIPAINWIADKLTENPSILRLIF